MLIASKKDYSGFKRPNPLVLCSVGSLKMTVNFFSWETFSNVSEYLCYSGSAVSVLIAFSLLRMGNINTMTFFNKMFILYFGIDAVTGILEEYFLFRLKEDRSLEFMYLCP